MKQRKDRLRSLAREYSDNAVIEIGKGLPSKESATMQDEHKKEITQLYMEIFDVNDTKELHNMPLQDFF